MRSEGIWFVSDPQEALHVDSNKTMPTACMGWKHQHSTLDVSNSSKSTGELSTGSMNDTSTEDGRATDLRANRVVTHVKLDFGA